MLDDLELKISITGEAATRYRRLAVRVPGSEHLLRTAVAVLEHLYAIKDAGGTLIARMSDGTERPVDFEPGGG